MSYTTSLIILLRWSLRRISKQLLQEKKTSEILASNHDRHLDSSPFFVFHNG